MRRLYFLVPDMETSKKIVDELLLARFEERHIHVIAKPNTPMENLPEASHLQKSDLIPALEQGLAVGGLVGVLVGLIAITFPGGIVLAGGAVLAITTFTGAGFGALMSSMIGSSVDNRRVKQFEESLEKGEFLFLIDVPKDRIEEVKTLIKKHHPEAEFGGVEPKTPVFP